MKTKTPRSVTELVERYKSGDRSSVGEIVGAMYDDLRRIARSQMRSHRPGTGSLTPTGLVHELFETFQKRDSLQVNDREHFLRLASKTMRWLLLDRAKAHHAERRGAGQTPVQINEEIAPSDTPDPADLYALEQAMRKLREKDERLAQIAELRILAGMEIEEVATTLSISASTVKRDWALARAFLVRELGHRSAA